MRDLSLKSLFWFFSIFFLFPSILLYVAFSSPFNDRRRKNQVRRTIRVPAISSNVADIPPDDGYSWSKYDQKLINGSPFPR
jgi:hypothetical protein